MITLIVPIFLIILLLIIIIGTMTKTTIQKHFSPVKVYALLISASTMIAILISLSIVVYSTLQNLIITDEEYVISDRGYYNECEPFDGPKRIDSPDYIEYSDEEIAECNEKRAEGLLAQRSINFKETLIASGTWLIIALILFMFHLPMLRKEEKN